MSRASELTYMHIQRSHNLAAEWFKEHVATLACV